MKIAFFNLNCILRDGLLSSKIVPMYEWRLCSCNACHKSTIFIKKQVDISGKWKPCMCVCMWKYVHAAASLFSGSCLLHPAPTSTLHIWRCWCAEQKTIGCHKGQIPALYLGPVRGSGKSLALDPTMCSDLSFLYMAFFTGPYGQEPDSRA